MAPSSPLVILQASSQTRSSVEARASSPAGPGPLHRLTYGARAMAALPDDRASRSLIGPASYLQPGGPKGLCDKSGAWRCKTLFTNKQNSSFGSVRSDRGAWFAQGGPSVVGRTYTRLNRSSFGKAAAGAFRNSRCRGMSPPSKTLARLGRSRLSWSLSEVLDDRVSRCPLLSPVGGKARQAGVACRPLTYW